MNTQREEYRKCKYCLGMKGNIPHSVVSAGCSVGWDEHAYDLIVTYHHLPQLTPGLVLIRPKPDSRLLLYRVGPDDVFYTEVQENNCSLGLDVSDGKIIRVGSVEVVISIERMPFLYRWLIEHSEDKHQFRKLFSRLYVDHGLASLDLSSEHKEVLLLMLDRQGQATERERFCRVWAGLASDYLGRNVQRYEQGTRPSDMLSLLQYQPLSAAADRVLTGELDALEYLGLIDPEFGIPSGALESMARPRSPRP